MKNFNSRIEWNLTDSNVSEDYLSFFRLVKVPTGVM